MTLDELIFLLQKKAKDPRGLAGRKVFVLPEDDYPHQIKAVTYDAEAENWFVQTEEA